jgi:PAS domain S-box-containing protein
MHSPEQIIRDLFQQTPDSGLIVLSLDGRIQYWIGACRLIFGYTAEEAIGQPGDILFTEDDRRRGIPALEFDEAIRAPRAEDDRWHVRKDGTRVWISGSAFALRDEAKAPYAIAKLVRDHTDRRSYVETLEHRLSEQHKASAFKEVSVAALAHELRNPLAPLANAVHLIRIAAPKTAQLNAPLAIIERQMAALQRLVSDLLDAGRVATGKMNIQLQPGVELNSLLRLLADGMRHEFDHKKINLELVLPPSLVTLEADPDRLAQAVTNLLTNALRYTNGGGTVWLKSTVEENLAVIRVQDTGVGLSAEVMPYVFKLFTRGPDAEKLEPHGMGVGLSVVKEIVSLHHGTLDVRSEGVGKGTEFSIRLPFKQEHAWSVNG